MKLIQIHKPKIKNKRAARIAQLGNHIYCQNKKQTLCKGEKMAPVVNLIKNRINAYQDA